MSFLIDTNVVSEVRKGDRCDAGVAAWFATVPRNDLWLSVLVLGEVRKGVELARRKDPDKAEALEEWLEGLDAGFGDRIIPIDVAISAEWGRLNAIRPVNAIDGLMAATAKVKGLTLVTRNEGDIAGLGAETVNPFNR